KPSGLDARHSRRHGCRWEGAVPHSRSRKECEGHERRGRLRDRQGRRHLRRRSRSDEDDAVRKALSFSYERSALEKLASPRRRGTIGEAATVKSLSKPLVCAAALMLLGNMASAQTGAPTNNLPDPYKRVANWAKMPQGRFWGASAGVDIDPDGKSVWALDRCG